MEQDEKKTKAGSSPEKKGEATVSGHGLESENNADSKPEDEQAKAQYSEKVFEVTIPDDETGQESAQNDDTSPEDTDDERKNHPLVKSFVYTLSIVVVSILLAVGILYAATDYLGMFRPEKTAEITINKNETSIDKVAAILKENGIIRSPFVFKLYAKISNKKGLHEGQFSLSSSMSYDAIIRKLRSTTRATVKVTIPEGFTLQQIGERLEKNKVCTKQQFLSAVEKADITFDFSSQIPSNKDRFYRLEGYLFPDTYEFYVDQAPDAVIKKMLRNFDTRFNDAFRKAAASSGMTVDEIITLASIIQTESSNKDQMAKVSSVFHNRLKHGVDGRKLLQSDATIFYATREIEPILPANSTNIASAYNTYKHEGLPPGPICNPGLAAIDAALAPADTNYYYFVTDKNGNYYYAETYAKHLINVRKAENTGKAGGTNVTKSDD